MRTTAWWAVALLWAAMGNAVAAGPAAQEPEKASRTERIVVAYTVNPDGSFTEDHEVQVRVLRADALEALKDTTVSYSASMQRLEVQDAHTLKADGRKVPVPAGNYQLSTRTGRGDAGPAFSDQASTTIVFPDLAVGDATVLRFRRIGSRPMFDGHFSLVDSFDDTDYLGDLRVTVDLPAALAVAGHRSYGGFAPARVESRGDRRVYTWAWQNRTPRAKRPPSNLYRLQEWPGYAITTFPSNEAIAQAYAARALPKAVPTERVRTLAAEVAGGASDPREATRLLYEWVSTRITYAGNCIGVGAVVPRDLDFVLDNRMGDCKDHATLLQALLAARGIESTQALVNAGNGFELPDLALPSMVNHVMNYVPSLDLYLDATAKGVPFGMLSAQVAGKPVLRLDGARDARTPHLPRERNRHRLDATLRVAADGSLSGTVKVDTEGVYAMTSREMFRQLPASDLDTIVETMFARGGIRASGSLQRDDPAPLLDRHAYSATLALQQVVQVPGAMSVQSPLFAFGGADSFADQLLADPADAAPTACFGATSEERFTIEFAPELKVLAVPPDLEVGNEAMRYRATYALQGNTLRVERRVEDLTEGPLCTADQMRRFDEVARRIAANLKAQVLVQ